MNWEVVNDIDQAKIKVIYTNSLYRKDTMGRKDAINFSTILCTNPIQRASLKFESGVNTTQLISSSFCALQNVATHVQVAELGLSTTHTPCISSAVETVCKIACEEISTPYYIKSMGSYDITRNMGCRDHTIPQCSYIDSLGTEQTTISHKVVSVRFLEAQRVKATISSRYLPRILDSTFSTDTMQFDGGILMSGGLGALSTIIARHIYTNKPRTGELICASRSGRSARFDLNHSCPFMEISVHKIDVASWADFSATFAAPNLACEYVLHASGLLYDGLSVHQNPNKIRTVCAPKHRAAEKLQCAFSLTALRAWLVFSSTSHVLKSTGQANYAAANAMTDSFAQNQTQCGNVWKSIQ